MAEGASAHELNLFRNIKYLLVRLDPYPQNYPRIDLRFLRVKGERERFPAVPLLVGAFSFVRDHNEARPLHESAARLAQYNQASNSSKSTSPPHSLVAKWDAQALSVNGRRRARAVIWADIAIPDYRSKKRKASAYRIVASHLRALEYRLRMHPTLVYRPDEKTH
jgi:hypothetical protein